MDRVTFGIVVTLVVSLVSIILFVLTIIFGIIKTVKKKFKKTFIVLLIVTILFGFVDCFTISNLIRSFNKINISQKDGKIILSDNLFEQLFMSDDKKTEIICEQTISKIKTKDYETIKSIFSNDMIKNVKNLDDGIIKLIGISNENITDYNSQLIGSETHWDNGQHRKTYRFNCEITTNNTKYCIGFEYDYENPFNNKTLGVNRMVILDESRSVLVLVDNETINKGY